jgi:transposase
MEKVSIIGLDLAKRSFQAHGARAEGGVAFRKKLSREKVLTFLAEQPRCVVAMEACGSAHHWGRTIRDLGHEVRLIPPAYVKPFVKRQKNDAADAEAIVEAASRPTMRFVAVKTEEQQARAMLFRTRDLLVRQRTQLINALRGHLSEHGVVAAQGPANVKVLEEAVEDQGTSLPLLVVELARVFLDQIEGLWKRISGLTKRHAEKRHGVCRPCRASAPSLPWRSRPSRHRWMSSNVGAISPPGSGSCPGNIRPGANRFSGKSRRWGSAIFVAC